MRIKALLALFLAPLLAFAQVEVFAPGAPVSIGGGVRVIVDYDIDALLYFQRAGVTNSLAKSQISAFVRGTKALGIWNQMVCWPLRSSQNAGTGTVAYSLGGLPGGPYNGTLVNGPTWGVDGVVQDASGQRISTTFDLSLTMSFINIVNRAAGYTWSSFGQAVNSSLNYPIAPYLHNATGQSRFSWQNPAAQVNSIANGTNADVFQSVGFTWTDSVLSVWKDAAQLAASTAITGAPLIAGTGQENIMLGNAFGGINDSRGANSFAAFFNVTITDALYQSLYALYKSTIGQGLGLP